MKTTSNNSEAIIKLYKTDFIYNVFYTIMTKYQSPVKLQHVELEMLNLWIDDKCIFSIYKERKFKNLSIIFNTHTYQSLLNLLIFKRLIPIEYLERIVNKRKINYSKFISNFNDLYNVLIKNNNKTVEYIEYIETAKKWLNKKYEDNIK